MRTSTRKRNPRHHQSNLPDSEPRLVAKHEQEAIEASLRRKYPDGSVNKVVAKSPDLAIVQGAAHYAPMQQKPPPPRGSAPFKRAAPPAANVLHYPTAPQYQAITAPNSYGILTTQVGQAFSHPMYMYVRLCTLLFWVFIALLIVIREIISDLLSEGFGH